jgi:hypothetical protein
MFHRTMLAGSMLFLAANLAAAPPLAMAQRVRVSTTGQTIEMHLADDVLVRWQHAPMQFDEKGKPVKPTAEQLKALKGDPNQPGYAAETSDLKRGQIVKVYLSRRKIPKSETGADKKPHWTPLGDITGQVTRVPGDHPGSKGNANESSQQAGSEPTLVISVDEVLLTRFKVPRNQGKVALGADVFARKVMILKDAPEEKKATKQ